MNIAISAKAGYSVNTVFATLTMASTVTNDSLGAWDRLISKGMKSNILALSHDSEFGG
jgi:hypothetical protein